MLDCMRVKDEEPGLDREERLVARRLGSSII